MRNETFREDLESLDSQLVLYEKVQDHGKELILPKALQKYVLYDSHHSLDHSGTTQMCQFLRRQYY